MFGLRLRLLLFVTIACIGQMLFAMGGFISQLWLMAVGRFVYGGGTELAISALDIFTGYAVQRPRVKFCVWIGVWY